MTEADYVRSQAKHDREERANAITELRALQAAHHVLQGECFKLRLENARLRGAD